jgi:hypothetical protein
MKIARTTKTSLCRALAVACCFALLPVLVCAQNTDDKNKKKAAPAPAPAQQPARPAQQAPAPQPPPRQVQQVQPQQQPQRQVQQAPVQQPSAPPQQRQVPPNQYPQNPNTGGQQPRGIAGQNPQTPNTGGQQPRGISGAGGGGITGNSGRGGGITGGAGGNSGSGGGITGNSGRGAGITGEPRGISGASGGGITGNSGRGGGIAGGGPKPAAAGPTYHAQPGVQSTRQPDGGFVHADQRTGMKVHTDPGGRITIVEKPGLKATGFRPDGNAARIEHTRADGSTLVVNRGLRGDRRIEVVQPGGVRVVAVGRQSFVERPGRTGYVSRTYVVGGRTEVRVYRSYSYRSVSYVTYVPRVYYQPAFYGWAARPWGPTVAYSWGWAPAAPWFYGGYFAPAPVYSTPALWLTDFLLAANLQAAYDNRQQQYQDQQQEPLPAQSSGVVLTPEIKALVAEEVKQQLEVERLTALQPTAAPPAQPSGADVPPPALKQRVFVVSTSLDVTALGSGESCGLSAGDIIERTPGQSVTTDGKVAVNVMSSKAGDCPADFATQIDVATLQDMQNDFKKQIASGMETLASNSGKGGLPASPAANPRPNADGQAPPNPSTDAQSRDLVAKLNLEADQTEADIRRTAGGGQ